MSGANGIKLADEVIKWLILLAARVVEWQTRQT